LLELLDQGVREQSVFNLIDGLSGAVGNVLESRPNEQGTGNVVSLDTGFATLTGFYSSQRFEFPMKLHPAGSKLQFSRGHQTPVVQHL
jgi:hypothetical protein